MSAPSVKQQLAAIRMLFDWLVVGQVALLHISPEGIHLVIQRGSWTA
ncbi:hypothetical protein ACFQY5_35345 [Paeniroseomonas aquatica]|uniref:Uncharacterized protein n=1 Tax=Paeniroseomonas aquatica TaxID=373043 RepID=A0ABT8AGW0_9PROT|nr:hypothetical protein [Paeniroseomonas aquatica]MDN3568589.1 hypothetical protein [Paeniroseomonas aquatica]